MAKLSKPKSPECYAFNADTQDISKLGEQRVGKRGSFAIFANSFATFAYDLGFLPL
jgi:hypothetical protein